MQRCLHRIRTATHCSPTSGISHRSATPQRWLVGTSRRRSRNSCCATFPGRSSVRPQDAEMLWHDRKRLFFKPACGFGSGGAYRGDKLTRRVFAEILAGQYVAQALVPPSERNAPDDNATPVLKVDLRNYVYDGEVLLIAARLYQGQTTRLSHAGRRLRTGVLSHRLRLVWRRRLRLGVRAARHDLRRRR